MSISINQNLNLPETPQGVPEELFSEFRRLYNALRSLAGYANSITQEQTAITPFEGFAPLVAGQVVIPNVNVTVDSKIFLSIQQLGTVVDPKAIAVVSRTPNVDFTIKSADVTDTSVVAWSFLPD